MKHTPGPWTCTFRKSQVDGVNIVFEIDANPAINIAGGQSQEHLMHVQVAILEHECRANAKLMTAAPDLLEALYTAEALLLNMGMQSSDAYQEINAAIAKAEA